MSFLSEWQAEEVRLRELIDRKEREWDDADGKNQNFTANQISGELEILRGRLSELTGLINAAEEANANRPASGV